MSDKHQNEYGLIDRDMTTIHHIFKKYPMIRLVHIFGSRAKGNFNVGSDVDLAIMSGMIDILSLSRLKSDFEESSLPYKVDLVYVPTLSHPDLIDHINRVGKLFYKQELT